MASGPTGTRKEMSFASLINVFGGPRSAALDPNVGDQLDFVLPSHN